MNSTPQPPMETRPSMEAANHRILIVDDDADVRDAFRQILTSARSSAISEVGAALFGSPGHQTQVASQPYALSLLENGEKGVAAVQDAIADEAPFALAFIDMRMPGIDGAETAKRILQVDPRVKVVIVTAMSDQTPEEIVAATGQRDLFYLRKPFDPAEIRQVARALTYQWHIEREREALSGELTLRNRQLLKYAEALQTINQKLKSAQEQLTAVRDHEIDIASRIQRMLLLGRPPETLQGVKIKPMTIPSQQVDGDFYEFYQIDDHTLDVIVGDVMGKGIPAALLGAATKNHILQALTLQDRFACAGELPEPAEIIQSLHDRMIHQLEALEAFVTLVYARFDFATRRLRFVDCGHTRTIHCVVAEGTCRLLEGVNMPLGFPEKGAFEQVEITFSPGDTFVFYSDGLTEAQNPNGDMYGEAQLADFVERHGHLAPEAIIRKLRDEIFTYAASDVLKDDFTSVALRIDLPPSTDRLPLDADALEILSELEQMAAVRAFVRRFCAAVPAERFIRGSAEIIELAVHEAVTNIIRHAYKGRPGQPIRVEAERFADELVFRLYDQGWPFDPQKVPEPQFDGSQNGGYGLYIMRQTLDEIRFLQTPEGRNCTWMRVRLSVPE